MVLAPDIPGHRVAGVLGTGGFATVYRSWQLAVGREVAVKVDNRVLLSERDRRRFLREVTAAGRLSGHPHVIDVYDAGTLGDGRPYLVMELCPAGSLNDALRRHGPMSAAQVRDIGIRICDALAAAHAAGVLHRDIKPANILVNRYGMVGLSDFGLASIMAAGGEQSATRDALTPAYASPETFRSEEPTAAADIYSLAATLYALLAGRPPRFPAGEMSPSLMAIMMLHDKPVEDVPGAPPELMALLRQGLAADPAARLGSAAALRDALAALPGRPAQAARPPAQAARPPAQAARPPAQAAPPSGPLVPAAGPAAVAAGSAGESSAARSTSGGANGSTAGGVHAGLTTRRGRVVRPIAAAVGLVVIVAVAAIIGVRVLPHGGPGTAAGAASAGNRAAPQVFGIPTVTSGCPAASVPVAAARCPQSPECWDGLVIDSGNATAASLPCGQPHSWETFAIAILPADVRTYDYELVAANRVVRTVCSMPLLLKSRLGGARQIPERAWEIDVLPPDQAAFDSGARAYRCVAHRITRPAPRTAQFGP